MIVADTSVWIDYFRGKDARHTEILDYELEHERIVIGDLILAELLQGFRNERDFRAARQMMERLEYRDFVGKHVAIQAAMNFRRLRQHGITVRKTIDVIIATFCIENGFALIHNDRDFDAMEKYIGLNVRK